MSRLCLFAKQDYGPVLKGAAVVYMAWNKLLSRKRIRELLGGPRSSRIGGERRTEFERDYDRAIFSTPVKRMQDKAQVFPLEPNDSIRTRLTHSLEVSTVAKGLAGSAAKWMLENNELTGEHDIRAIEAIAMTCGLIHDLGNPPFGHAGEIAIQEWFSKRLEKHPEFFSDFDRYDNGQQLRQDFLLFEGNAQTLRLISRLQILADEYGLNLTAGTFSAACKYVVKSDGIDESCHLRSKVGYFASEDDVITVVRDETGTGAARNPIAFLVEACDDAVYSTVDLEDGVKKGVLHWRTFEKWMREADDEEGIISECLDNVQKQIGQRSVDLRGRAEDEAKIQAFRVSAIFYIVQSVFQTFKDHYEEIMAGNYASELWKDSRAYELVKVCKLLGTEFVYCSEQNLRLEIMGRRVIHDLMDSFWEGAEPESSRRTGFPDKMYSLMSRNYRTVCELAVEKAKLPPKYCKLRLVTDYICGMTDGFACDLHKRLTNG